MLRRGTVAQSRSSRLPLAAGASPKSCARPGHATRANHSGSAVKRGHGPLRRARESGVAAARDGDLLSDRQVHRRFEGPPSLVAVIADVGHPSRRRARGSLGGGTRCGAAAGH
eukprot:14941744-Alexandrium_andersonii.AAC.1